MMDKLTETKLIKAQKMAHIDDTLKHIKNVQELIDKLIIHLARRSQTTTNRSCMSLS
jgi:hypothetical protein